MPRKNLLLLLFEDFGRNKILLGERLRALRKCLSRFPKGVNNLGSHATWLLLTRHWSLVTRDFRYTRSAVTGSIRAARRAGRKQAMNATPIITINANPKATGSRGLTS